MRYYFEATEINCAIDQIKPGLKSMVQYFIYFLLFKESAICRSTTSVYTAYYTHRDAQQHTNIFKYLTYLTFNIFKKNKGLQCQRLLLCRLHK